MLKKFFNLFLLVVFLVTIGLGCKGLTAEEQAAIKPITLNYWTVYNDVNELKKFADEYKKVRPYVTVNIKQVRAEEFDKLFVNALADDVAPDLVSIHSRELKRYQARLDEMPVKVDVSKIEVKGQYTKETVVTTESKDMPTVVAIKNNFITTVYNDVVIGDKIYGLPLAVDTLAIYYNKTLLDKSGVPEAPKNWDEFMKAVQASTKFNDKGEILQAGTALGTSKNVPRAFDILSALMIQSGVIMSQGSYVTFAGGVEKLGSQSSAITALRFYTDFARPTKEVYAWNEKMPNALDAFVQGKVVFYFGFAYDYPKLKARAPQMNFEILPLLQLNEKQPANIANYWLEAVVKKTKNRNEAWDFLMFMASPENIKKYCVATHRPTPLRSQITEQQKDLTMQPFTSQILNSENWYHGQDITATEAAFTQMIDNYLLPTGSESDQNQQDKNLLLNAARKVQQTM